MTSSHLEKANRFHALHQEPGFFVIANAWDAGSARILAGLGFQALATSSSASAGVLGRRDGTVMRQEALDHACAIVAATDLPGLVGTRSTVGQWFARSRERQALREIAERNVLL